MKLHQRLTIDQIKRWNAMKYGMFIHFGLSTFVGEELPSGDDPSDVYAPTNLDVEQWIRVAHDAGMKYAVLTAKHVSGHCLWPSKHTDYSVSTAGNQTDVVKAFVEACRKYGLMPGLYYCMWDNHHILGSRTPGRDGTTWQTMCTSPAFWQFAQNQLDELCTQYGPIGEFFLDIPGIVPRTIRESIYERIAKLQPDAVIDYNSGMSDGAKYNIAYAWPSDIINIERTLPPSGGFATVREIEGKNYHMLGEVCDTIGKDWFYTQQDRPRGDEELLGIYLLSTARGANLLLDVPPDRTGTIPAMHVDALMRLRANLDKLGV